MTKRYLIPIFVLLLALSGVVGITWWNAVQLQHSLELSHQRWVLQVSRTVAAKRNQFSDWIRSLPAPNPAELDRTAQENPEIAALFYADNRRHMTRYWIDESIHSSLQPLDERLGVLRIRALETGRTLTGPIIFAQRTPYATVVRPIDSQRVLIVFIRDTSIRQLLKDELAVWGMRGYVCDFDGHLIYVSDRLKGIEPFVQTVLEAVRLDRDYGSFHLKGAMARNTFLTFHHDRTNDWIFILGDEAPFTYMPIVFFVVGLIACFFLARIPYRAAHKAHVQTMSHDLSKFAAQIDAFVRSNEATLKEPPDHLEELEPVVHTLRWLMPQWKKAEAFPKELVLERKLLSLLIESLPEGILFFNASGNLQLSNELGRVFLSLHQDVNPQMKVVNGVQVPRGFLEPFLEPVLSGRQPNLGKEVEVSWADGKHLYRVWVERVDGEANKLLGYIAVVRDITFRKQWEYVQEQVLSGITHDLRGPLSALMGYMDLVRRQLGTTAPPKIAEYLGLAREAGVRLSQMVSDILDVVRFEQGKIDLEPAAIPVGEMFERLQHTFGVLAEQKKVRLQLEIEGDARMTTWGDRRLLERVFDNLVGNAIKFTPSQGTISVHARRSIDRVTFEVTDTGRGIPREAQSRIFDKFQQVRPGDRSSGYGLGLAVAKFIVEAHKGEIRVESEVGSGSRFTFWIPDQETVAVSPEEKTPPDTQAA